MNHIRKPVTLLLICCLLVGLSLTSSISATAQTTTAEQMELEEFDLEAAYGEIYVREDGVKEDVFSRKENAKLFEESDGTMTFEIYGERQHFLDDGKYVTIDNEVVEMQPAQRASLAASQSSGYRYMNKANDVRVLFSDAASLTDMVMVQKGDYTLTLSAQSATGLTAATSSALAKATTKSWLSKYQGDDSTVIYGRDKNISYVYQVQNNGVKEEIVMGQYTGQNVFTFAIKAPGLVVAQGTNGDYVFRSQETNEEVFYLEAPFMYDAEGKVSYDVTYAFTPVQDGYTLTVTASENFLTDPSTVYPVTIDPSVINAYSSFVGVNISSLQPTYSNSTGSTLILETGSSTYGTRRALIKFSLPSELNGVAVNSAQLEINTSATSSSNIAFTRLTSSWTKNVNWNTAPTIDYTIRYAANASGKYILDVKNDVNGYLSGSLTNYGYLLRLGNESQNDYVMLYSGNSIYSNRLPKLVINVNGITGMLRYPVLTPEGTRFPINQDNLFATSTHTGIDIISRQNNDISGRNVYSVYQGTVVLSQDNYKTQGNTIVIKHTINGITYLSKYCHLSSRSVNTGTTVTKSTIIGTVGKTGNATNYHLHLELHRHSDPEKIGVPSAINPEQGFELNTGITNHNTAMIYGDIKNYTTCSANCTLKVAVFPGTLHSNYENNLTQRLPRLPYVGTNPKAWCWAYGNYYNSYHKSPSKYVISDIDLGTATSKTVYVVAYGCASCASRNGNIVLRKQIVLHSGEIAYVSLDPNPS